LCSGYGLIHDAIALADSGEREAFMDELLPIAIGLALGVLFASGSSWLRPWWIRTPLVVLAGVSTTVTSGEFHATWAFVLVDVGEVALLAWMGFASARAVRRRRQSPNAGKPALPT
jgi:hypothetical protein